MKVELSKSYNPRDFEDDIYYKWEESGFFNPDNLLLPETAPSFSMVLPPPNITDKLHVGHSLVLSIEDLMVRYHRLKGYRSLWLPGTDHAAIATQNVVEKKVLKEQGKTRHELGREAFLKELDSFVSETQTTILKQTRKMGASLDWSRLAFTLDDNRGVAVRQMFKDMYEAGVIYRGERIVNWCPRCQSTLADDEVEHHEQATKLYTFKYSADFPISISTTRPETKLGDSAVAVNPKDKRYKKFIGQTFEVDFVGQTLKIKIVADPKVDMDFGTGALGVTPAHSLIDWQIAERNNLEIIKVIDEEGKIRSGYGDYSALSAKEAGEKIVANLRKANLLEKEEEINNNLSACYRCRTAIEPLPSKQWFVGVDRPVSKLGGKSLKEAAYQVASSGEIKFIPERFNKRYLDWMENLHDWCISRQIWFGHQVPVWYKGEELVVGDKPDGNGWQQDPDTLDTWFSSGMWTFSTLGWPENFKDGKKIDDLARFHPTQVLETGSEIITLWVSRMIMMSLFALQEIPFKQVYLHGMVLDKDGKKMSKSKGNGIDPVEMIEKYGADALRLSLLTGSTPGNSLRFSEEKTEAKRNLVNKLWNISRFILSSSRIDVSDREPTLKTAADYWIISNFNKLLTDLDAYLKNYEFSLAAEALEDFTWNKLADWYLEIAKVETGKEDLLIYLLKNLLKLWHPFIPFVTEVIWQQISDSLLMTESWPQVYAGIDKNIEQRHVADINRIIEIIKAIRDARSQNKIEPSKKLTAKIYTLQEVDLFKDQAEVIKSLKTGLQSLDVIEAPLVDKEAILIVSRQTEIYLLGGLDKEKERARLDKEKANLEKMVNSLSAKLANKDFCDRAPKEIVAKEKERLVAYQEELDKLNNI